MHIRPYHANDLSAIGDVMTAANVTDTLSNYFRRNIDLYPFTDRQGGVRFIKGLVLGVGTYCFVMETDVWDPITLDHASTNISNFNPRVVGWVMFTRKGTSSVAQRWQSQNSSAYDIFNRWLMKLEGKYYSFFPSVTPTFDAAAFATLSPLLYEPWDPVIFAEAWEVNALFVHPDYQRRGLGRKLLQWGMDRASEERIPLIVAGSALGGPAYRKAGFESIGVSGFGEFFDEAAFGGEEMQRWVWQPEGVDVLEEARGKAAEVKRAWMEKRKEKKRQ